ncbi:MAG: DUF4281 domain-containing protein [Alphaproteobacteria bacterium]|nr:DUF4281 domain-containing protein [Alphaproteobacteria bacterium]
MTLDTAFSAYNALAVVGWAILILAPSWRFGRNVISGRALPALFSLSYAIIFLPALIGSEGGFVSIEALRTLLTADPRIVLGAWLHYLAFDMFIGAWMAGEAEQRGIPHAWMVPVLLATFLAGPVGWLAFFALRRRYPTKIAQP